MSDDLRQRYAEALAAAFTEPEQRDRVLGFALDGLRQPADAR